MSVLCVQCLKAAVLALSVSMLLPVALLTLATIALVAFPIACVVLPFMLVARLGRARREGRDEGTTRVAYPALRLLQGGVTGGSSLLRVSARRGWRNVKRLQRPRHS